jgi:hypothetical protein
MAMVITNELRSLDACTPINLSMCHGWMNGWMGWIGNYRHQADACHAYQIVKKNGIPEERIIIMVTTKQTNTDTKCLPRLSDLPVSVSLSVCFASSS